MRIFPSYEKIIYFNTRIGELLTEEEAGSKEKGRPLNPYVEQAGVNIFVSDGTDPVSYKQEPDNFHIQNIARIHRIDPIQYGIMRITSLQKAVDKLKKNSKIKNTN